MAGLFDWKKQPAYQAYSSHSVRPDGLPPYEVDENGFYKVAPGELYCRAYDEENAICPNDRKQWQPSNLRHHLKTTHKYTLLDLPPGKANVVDAKKIDRFYQTMNQRITEAAGTTEITNTESGPVATPSKTKPTLSESSRRGSNASAKDEKLPIPRKKDGIIHGVYMRKSVGFSGRACDGCIGLKRKAAECPPAKPDGVCVVWPKFKTPAVIDLEEEDQDEA